MAENEVKQIKSVEKAMKILSAFSLEEPELGVIEISKKVGLYKSTVSRFLETLRSEDFVRKNPDTGKYRLGMKLFYLGKIPVDQLDISQYAKPHLKHLSQKFDETVSLAIYDNENIISIDRIMSTKQVAMRPRGLTAPFHCSALGRAIVAYLPGEEVDKLINKHGLPPYTSKTITDPEKLKDNLKQIREQGYAFDNEEHENWLKCIAVPIKDYSGGIAGSISISVPSERLTEELFRDILSTLLEISEIVSRELGYKSNNFRTKFDIS